MRACLTREQGSNASRREIENGFSLIRAKTRFFCNAMRAALAALFLTGYHFDNQFLKMTVGRQTGRAGVH